jgi:hypothetical protein
MWSGLRSPAFSIVAGIIAPLLCFALQPLLLSDSLRRELGLRFINVFWLFTYCVAGLEMLVLALWLAFGTRLGAWNGPIAGGLFAGALFAGGLGLILLPLSLIGLMMIIGALGFVPFLTATTYCANAVEAYRHARKVAGGAGLLASAVVGALLVIGVPIAIQARVSREVQSAIRDVAAGKPRALEKLRAWYPFAPPDTLLSLCADELDFVRRQRLADAYKKLTGEDVNSVLGRLAD